MQSGLLPSGAGGGAGGAGGLALPGAGPGALPASSDRVAQLLERLGAYPWWQVLIELVIVWFLVLIVVRFVQGTRAAGILKSVLFLIVVSTLLLRILGQREAFQRLTFLYDNFLGIVAIALIVIFQPELRRGLTRIGETSLFRKPIRPQTQAVDAIVQACLFLAKARFGGLIVIERQVPLRGLAEGGTVLNAEVSSRLLQTIFFPGSALHDLAVIIRGNVVRAAGVQLPLAEEGDLPDPALGSRHRAAVGITQESDAVAVVVSEETGTISLAERGRLTRGLNEAELRGLLVLKVNPGLVTSLAQAPPASAADEASPVMELEGGGEEERKG